MKKATLSILVTLLSVCGLHATNIEVSDTISSNTTWTGVDTVKVIGDIHINNGITLTIDPGIIVEFQGYYKIEVQGSLLAEGTLADTITFTTNDTTGYHNHSNTGWNGIIYDSTLTANDSSFFSYCRIEYSKGVNCGAMFIKNFNKVKISNCIFTRNDALGGLNNLMGTIYCEDADIHLSNSKIIDNFCLYIVNYRGHALAIKDCSPTIDSNIIINNASVLMSLGAYKGQILILQVDSLTKPLISNNRITANGTIDHETGISSLYASPQIINNIITGHSDYGIYLFQVTSETSIKGNLVADNSTGFRIVHHSTNEIIFSNNTIVNNYYGIYFYNSRSEIYNSIIYNNTHSQIYLNDDASDPDFYRCNIQDGKAGFTGTGSGVSYTGDYIYNISTGPEFTGTGDHPYSLSATSPCINSGTCDISILNLPDYDLAGFPRINNCPEIVDMGAYEYQGNSDVPVYYWYRDEIHNDITWSCIDTIKMLTDLTIVDSASLSIGQDVVVDFEDYYSINVQGRLLARGTASEPVKFTVSDTSGYSGFSHTGWGGIDFIDVPSNNDSSKLVNCILEYSKDTIGHGCAVYVNNSSKLKLDSLLLINNYAKFNGGGLVFSNTSGSISNSNVANNYAGSAGGGIYCDSSNLIINNCRIDSNYVINPTANYSGGAGIYADTSVVEINASEIKYNELAVISGNNSGGAGIYAYKSTIDIDSSSITQNKIDTISGVESGGAGIHAYNSNLELLHSDVSYNLINGIINTSQTALHSGGCGIYGYGSVMLIDSNNIEHNDIDTIGQYHLSGGGGLSSVSSELQLSNNIINYNNILHSGGYSSFGGGLFLYYSVNNINNNHICYNSSINNGGGIYVFLGGQTLTNPQLIINNTINHNTSITGHGGGIFASGNKFDHIHIINNEISSNHAGYMGGGLYLNGKDSDTHFWVKGNLINNNSAYGSGGGIYSNGVRLKDFNNTIVYNTANNFGGGGYFREIDYDAKNSIYWGNEIPPQIDGGPQMYIIKVSPMAYTQTINYCNIEGGSNDIFYNAYLPLIYENNIETNPYFVNSGDHPYSLLPVSNSINAGTPDTTGLELPDDDLVGNPRIYDGTIDQIDIGAYEYQGDPIPAGYLGSALDFDGVDDFVSCGNDSSLTEFKQFTMEAWIKLENASLNQKILGKFKDWDNYYIMGVGSGQQYSQIAANGQLINLTAGTIPSNKWTHLAVTYSKGDGGSNGSCYAYINGETVFSKTDVTEDSISVNEADYPFRIGTAPWDTTAFLTDGIIDEVRIWDVALDSTLIRENMYRVLGGNETGLVSNWMFYEGTDTTARDLINNNDGTLHNMINDAWVSSTAPLPFTTTADGMWENNGTWATGQNSPVHPWSRGMIKHNITLNSNMELIEMVIDTNAIMTISTGDTLTVGEE